MLTRLALAALVTALAAVPVAAKEKTAPEWDCDFSTTEGRDIFSISDTNAFVSLFDENRSQTALSVWFHGPQERSAFDKDGLFAETLRGKIGFSPRRQVKRGRLFVHLWSPKGELEAKRLPKRRGYRGSVWFTAAEIAALVDGGEDLVVTYYDRDSAIAYRTVLTQERLLAASARLIALRAELDARLADPQANCEAVYVDVIVVH